jgi:TetR/AcrR family transcriptional regulator, copper-responsive repressor
MQHGTKKDAPVPRRPGRPRAYDPERALEQVTQAFWLSGLSGTSLDDLVAATAMNRPSLYAAFGDKKGAYLKALSHWNNAGQALLEDALAAEHLSDALLNTYRGSLSLYIGKDKPARGCFMLSTATVEATTDPEVRALLREGIRRVDQAFEARIRRAINEGELGADTDATLLAQLASSVLHALAVRARAGVPRAQLEALARAGAAFVGGLGV